MDEPKVELAKLTKDVTRDIANALESSLDRRERLVAFQTLILAGINDQLIGLRGDIIALRDAIGSGLGPGH